MPVSSKTTVTLGYEVKPNVSATRNKEAQQPNTFVRKLYSKQPLQNFHFHNFPT